MRPKKFFSVLLIVVVVAGALVAAVYYTQKSKQDKARQQLAMAEAFLEKGDAAKAEAPLAQILEQFPKAEITPQVLALLARSLDAQDKHAEAFEHWQRLAKEFPNNAYRDEAAVALAEYALYEKKDESEAKEAFEKFLKENPTSPFAARAGYGLAQITLAQGDRVAARDRLNELLDHSPGPDLQPKIEKLLGEVNLEILMSGALLEGDQAYTLQRRDTIYDLARKFKIPQDLLMHVNNISDAKTLRVDKRLKIPNVEFSIRVDKSDNTLTLLNHGKFFKKYTVRTGKSDYQTPAGDFKITDKIKDPPWTTDGKVIKAGDPANELGSRWMPFQGRTLGIHGTIHPESIGKYTSNGCVGMLKEDVEELFELVSVNTPVKIIGKQSAALFEKNEKEDSKNGS